MRFTLRQSEWSLDFLSTAEWYFVYELPNLAAGKGFSDQTRANIIPPPIVDADGEAVENEDVDDWNEFVRPDIDDIFDQSLAIVSRDIEAAQKSENPMEWFDEDEDVPETPLEGPMWRVPVTMDHAEAWYGVLNRARLLMNEEHGLAEDDSRFIASLFGAESGEIPQDKALMLAQYEFYCVIQNILIENVIQ